jgi:protein Mpv17
MKQKKKLIALVSISSLSQQRQQRSRKRCCKSNVVPFVTRFKKLVLVLLPTSTAAFVIPSTIVTSSRNFADSFPNSFSPLPSSSSTSSLRMSFQDVSDFYQTYPLQSAILTCGFKASVADTLAQIKDQLAVSSIISTNKTINKAKTEIIWEFRRNLAYVIYGGIFVGLMCHLEYNLLFPHLFGTEKSLSTVVEKVVFDDFVSAPLMWLPPAYLIKAWIYDYTMKEGLDKYWRDIQENDLLIKYWTIWVPAQTVSFSVIPDHLRVAFMASVSFFWFILFSSVSHDE